MAGPFEEAVGWQEEQAEAEDAPVPAVGELRHVGVHADHAGAVDAAPHHGELEVFDDLEARKHWKTHEINLLRPHKTS